MVKLKVDNIKKKLREIIPVESSELFTYFPNYSKKHVQRAIREMIDAGELNRWGSLADGRRYNLCINPKRDDNI